MFTKWKPINDRWIGFWKKLITIVVVLNWLLQSNHFTMWHVHLSKQTVYCLTSCCCYFHVELLLHYSFLCIIQLRYDSFLLLSALIALISGNGQFICIHLKMAGNIFDIQKSGNNDQLSREIEQVITKQLRNESFVPGIFSQNWEVTDEVRHFIFSKTEKSLFLVKMKEKISLFQMK